MGDSLSALSIICGILAALYISYESQIERMIEKGIPDYPEDSLEQYEELEKIIKHCIRPLLISSLTMVITLLPETIKIITTTLTFFIEKKWSITIFNPKYYSFASIMVMVIHFLFIFLLYKTVKWKKGLFNIKSAFDKRT